MKKILLFATTLLSLNGLYSQTTSPEVIASTGTHSTNANAQVSWTVGEVVTQTVTGAANTATQGFHQTQLIVTALEEPLADFHVHVFPNPASTELNIRFDQLTQSSLQIIDLQGKVVLEEKSEDALLRVLNVSQLSHGAYILQIAGNVPNQIQQFKIQIINLH